MGVLLPLTLQGKYVKSLAGKQVKVEIDAGNLIAVLLADGTDREMVEVAEASTFPTLEEIAQVIEHAAYTMFYRQDVKAGRIVEPTVITEPTPEETHNE